MARASRPCLTREPSKNRGFGVITRIECHFTALRRFALDNTDYRTHEDVQTAVEGYLAWRNGAREISVTNWKLYCRQHKKAGRPACETGNCFAREWH